MRLPTSHCRGFPRARLEGAATERSGGGGRRKLRLAPALTGRQQGPEGARAWSTAHSWAVSMAAGHPGATLYMPSSAAAHGLPELQQPRPLATCRCMDVVGAFAYYFSGNKTARLEFSGVPTSLSSKFLSGSWVAAGTGTKPLLKLQTKRVDANG